MPNNDTHDRPDANRVDLDTDTADPATDPATDQPPADENDAPPDDGEQLDTDSADIAAARKQAAKYRERLREAESERDLANELLTRTRQSVVDDALTAADIDPRLLAAAGHSVESLINPESGLIDRARLTEAIEAVRDEFKIPRGFTPNRSQGAGGEPLPPAKPSLADAFRRS